MSYKFLELPIKELLNNYFDIESENFESFQVVSIPQGNRPRIILYAVFSDTMSDSDIKEIQVLRKNIIELINNFFPQVSKSEINLSISTREYFDTHNKWWHEERENQIAESLNEIVVFGGRLEGSPSYRELFSNITNKIDKVRLYQTVKEILTKEFDYKSMGVKKNQIDDLIDYLDYGSSEKLPKILKNEDILSHLVYKICQKHFILKKSMGLEYVKFKLKSRFQNEISYYFFDPELEISVGTLRIYDDDNIKGNTYKLPKNTWKVSYSYVDEEVRGGGYGKTMYSIVLDEVDALKSDTGLYQDSLNIWVNVLPKYYYVYALFDDYRKPKRIKSDTEVLKHSEVHNYIALKNPNLLKIKLTD